MAEIKEMRARGMDQTRPDAPEAESLGEDFWKNARVVDHSKGQESVRLPVDMDVIDWFRRQGSGHLSKMNAVLRSYVEAQKTKG